MYRWIFGASLGLLVACANGGGGGANPSACGGIGEACCVPSTGENPCERNTLQCESADQTCRLRVGEGSCSESDDCFGTAQCNAASARCCLPDGVFSTDPTLCCSGFADRMGECTAYPELPSNCGRAGLECCDLSEEAEDLIGTRCPGEGLGSADKLLCARGFCYDCGGPGERCCNGTCERGTCEFDRCGDSGPPNTTWCDEAGEACCRAEDGTESCAGGLTCAEGRCSTRAPVDECDTYTARGCEACTGGRTSTGRFCGWCGDRCVSGTSSGSSDGTCTPLAGNWFESVSQCPAPRFCSELRSCDACAGGSHGLDCVWCDRPTGGSAPSCVSGSSDTSPAELNLEGGLTVAGRDTTLEASATGGGCVDDVVLTITAPTTLTGLTFQITPPPGAPASSARATEVSISAAGTGTSTAFRGRTAAGAWKVRVARTAEAAAMGEAVPVVGTLRINRAACANLCGAGESEVVRDASMCR